LRIGYYDGSVIRTNGIDSGFADNQVFAIYVVAYSGVGIGRLAPGIEKDSPTVEATPGN